MGDTREMRMWAWLEANRAEAERRYVEECRAIVNAPDFGPYNNNLIDDFATWCLENFDKHARSITRTPSGP